MLQNQFTDKHCLEKEKHLTENKEIQQALLSKIYSNSHPKKNTFEENNEEYDDPDKEDQLQPVMEETEEQIPKPVEIRKVKGWKLYNK